MEAVTRWRTSSRTAANEACVEAGATTGGVAIRDTKYAYRPGETSPVLAFGREEFCTLLAEIKSARLDLS